MVAAEVERRGAGVIAFTVPGIAVPQGSMRAFMRTGARFPVVTSDNRNLTPWRQCVALAAYAAMAEAQRTSSDRKVQLERMFGERPRLIDLPVVLRVAFFLPRPKSLPKHVEHAIKKPDCDKLVRGICDALTGIVWRDDSQVVQIDARKAYGDPPRAEIEVEELQTPPAVALRSPRTQKRGAIAGRVSTRGKSPRRREIERVAG